MKNKFTKKHKNVLITYGTQGMAKLSLAVVSGLKPGIKSLHSVAMRALRAGCRLLHSVSNVQTGSHQKHQTGSTPRARKLSLFGVFALFPGSKVPTVSSSVDTPTNTLVIETQTGSTPRARKLSLFGSQKEAGNSEQGTVSGTAPLSSPLLAFRSFPLILILIASTLLPLAAAFLPTNDITTRIPFTPQSVSAAPADTLNFQGRLLNTTGSLIPDGLYNMQFDLYNVSTGGSSLWTEDRLVTNTQAVSVTNGYYSVYLGEYDALPSIDWSQELYLGMTVRGTANCAWGSCTPADAEMTPRFKLTAVPFAFSAANVASGDTDSADSNDVTIQTGDATTSGTTGDIIIDTGSGATANGGITLGATNASTIAIGNSGSTTTITGSSILLNASTISRTAAGTTTVDLTDGSDTVFALNNSGAGVANFTVDGSITVGTLGATDNASFVCRNTANVLAGCNFTPLSSSIVDNTTDAFDLQEGSNNYININTTNGSENISFGNATTNPTFDFLGTGAITAAGLQLAGDDFLITESYEDVDERTGILIPMYIYPASVYTNTDYNNVIDLAKKYHDVPVTVIINPSSGPGGSTDVNYTAAIQRLHGAGVTVVGYVDTNYTTISASTVESDIDDWQTYYPEIDGILFDRMTTADTGGNVAYYAGLTSYAHGKSLYPAIGNSGAAVDEAYVTSDAADVIVTSETDGFAAESTLEGDFDDGNADFDYRYRSVLAYNEGTFDYDEISTIRKYAGSLYVTDDTAANPWDTVSTYLEDIMRMLATDPEITVSALRVEDAATFNGAVTVAAGSTFTNASSTLFTALAISDIASDTAIGTAAATVDVATTFDINQTSGGGARVLTLPSPTNTASGRVVYVNNVGSADFTMHGDAVAAGEAAAFIWNGTSWVATITFTNTGIDTLGAIGSSPNANGASISGTTLTLQPADASFGGVVTTVAQTFAGAKTFDSLITGQAGLTVTGAAISLNDSSNFNTSINGGASTGTVTVGNALAGNVTVASGGTISVTGTTTINTTGSDTTSIGNSSAATTITGTSLIINAATVARTAAGTTALDLIDGSDTTLAIGNSGAGDANVTIDGDLDVAGTLTSGTGDAFQVSAGGAVTAVGVDSGTGLIQGTGGGTITGTTAINTTGSAITSIGNATGTFELNSNTLDISTAGVLSGATGITSSGTINFTDNVTLGATDTDTLEITGGTGVIDFSAAYFDSCSALETVGGILTCGTDDGGSATTLQDAYDAGNSITTASSTDIDLILSSGSLDIDISDDTANTVSISRLDGAGTTDPAQLLVVENLDTSRSIADGILVSAATGGGLTDGLDVSDADITNAINIGANAIAGTNFSVTGAGALTAVGVDSGSGIIEGLGGLAVTNGNFQLTGGGTFQLDSSALDISTAGVITGATGVTSSGTINFSSLTPSRALFTDGSSNVVTTGASADLLASLSDETGTGVAVFNTSPEVVTSLTTSSASFDLLNTTATTVNAFGAATTLEIGAATGTTDINNNLTVTGGTATLGVASTTNGQLTLQNSTNAFTATLDASAQTTQDTVISFPDAGANTTDTICLSSVGNCDGSGGLQAAYDIGQTILTDDDEGDLAITVAEATDFNVNITGTGEFAIQGSGLDRFKVNSTDGVEIIGDLDVVDGSVTTAQGGFGFSGNLTLASENVGNVFRWTATNITISDDHASANPAPDATTSAERLVSSAANATLVSDNTTAVGAGTYTFSVYVKTDTGTEDFDIYIDGTGGSPTSGTHTSFSATTDWRRYEVTQTFTGGVSSVIPTLEIITSGGELHVWGAQTINFSEPGVYLRTDDDNGAAGIITGSFANKRFTLDKEGYIYFGHGADENNSVNLNEDRLRVYSGGSYAVEVDGTFEIRARSAAEALSIDIATGVTTLGPGTGTDQTFAVRARTTAADGDDLTVAAGAGGTGGTTVGGNLVLNGGAAGSGNANGGDVVISGGALSGTGVLGTVSLAPTTFLASVQQDFTGSANITQSNIDSFSTILISSDSSGYDATLSDPTTVTAGRVIYVTNVGSFDMTLAANSGSETITLKPSTTATMIWNGVDWTAAGASSSTDLQAAYDNTATSAGGAELVLNAAGGAADGLTVRNNATTPITGGLFEVQTSIGSNLFTVNNNATEYASNGGAETEGASASTFPASTWDATTGGTISRYTTAGDNIATGQAAVSVVTTTTNHGARNTLSEALTSDLTYTVSFAVRGDTNFSTLEVLYSPDGTTSGTASCASAQTVTSGQWTRISCSFVASGSIDTNNAILIRQTDSATRTFYIDNMSVNVNAAATYAADGSVDDSGSFATNWTAFDGGAGSTTVSEETSVIFDTSASAEAATTANASQGIRNNLAVDPAINTQYLVSFYARSTVTMTDSLAVGFLPAAGTTLPTGDPLCTDYNTQSLTADIWTKVTCLFTTDGTAITNPDVIIYQTDSSARSIFIDALSITLNTNNSNNVQIGGGNKGGPATLFTLDRSSSAPIAENNDAYLGSMYYDTTTGRIQCYEADGWGACGAAPDNVVNLNPEYAGAVLNGAGVGTMTADFCSDDAALSVNSSLCGTGQAKNFYRWTSPQATEQEYSIYVTYQLPETFNGFASDDTVQLVGRVDDIDDATVSYEMFRSISTTGSEDVIACGTETDVAGNGSGNPNEWYSVGINGNESTGCSLNSAAAGDFIIFKVNMKANSNANAFVSTLSFTTTGR